MNVLMMGLLVLLAMAAPAAAANGDACVVATTCGLDPNFPCATASCVANLCVYVTPALAGTVCRASAGLCDVQETCTGNSPACPADAFEGSNVTCRAKVMGAAGVCDVADKCSGTGPDCPDAKQPSGSACTSDSNACTLDQCDGTNNACQHPAAPAGTVCRTAAGVCDVTEVCDGSTTCPTTDAKQPSGFACTPDTNPCTLDQCNGTSNACQHPAGNAGTVCRASAGVCDAQETCTGSSTNCPADGKVAAGTPCRASAGTCDVAESCNGTGVACPAEGFVAAGTSCRASAGACDVAESCTGSSAACPTDGFASSGVCRASAGACDVAESCNGSGAACPADGFVAAGSPGGGNVFVSRIDGTVHEFTPAGVPVKIWAGTSNGQASSLAFDAAGNMYVPHWSFPTVGNTIERFTAAGVLIPGYFGQFLPPMTGYDCDPSSIDFDAAGNVYVGQANCSGDIFKFDAAGNFVARYDAAEQFRGTDHIDLASDGCTMFYSSRLDILRYNVCTRTQLPTFNLQPLPDTPYHLNILPDGGVLVANASAGVSRLDAAGNLIQTYFVTATGNLWGGVDLVGDGTFWASNAFNGDIARFDIQTGALLNLFNSNTSPAGVAVRP